MDNLHMNIWSLFSGIGGLELGLEDAELGHTTLQCEIDPFARGILDKHWGAMYRPSDVKKITGIVPIQCAEPDLICGGFPCQPHSVAGKQKGALDERHLWPEYARIIREYKPTFVVAENVPNIRRTGGLAEVLSDLAFCGYDAEWIRLGAAAVGAPHLRERIFIVAYPGCERRREVSGGAFADEGENGRKSESDNFAFGDASGNRSGIDSRSSASDSNSDSFGRTNVSKLDRWEKARKDGELWNHTYRLRANLADEEPFIFTDAQRAKLPIDPNETSWACEPNVGRVAYGVRSRVDRLRVLGNAVVPQVARFVGECIFDALEG